MGSHGPHFPECVDPLAAGYRVRQACGEVTGTLCVPCAPGTYTAHLNGLSECLQCQVCDPGKTLPRPAQNATVPWARPRPMSQGCTRPGCLQKSLRPLATPASSRGGSGVPPLATPSSRPSGAQGPCPIARAPQPEANPSAGGPRPPSPPHPCPGAPLRSEHGSSASFLPRAGGLGGVTPGRRKDKDGGRMLWGSARWG